MTLGYEIFLAQDLFDLLQVIAIVPRRSPSRSSLPLPRGGPVGRAWRNGRSQRSTCQPTSANFSASATRSGALQFPPAPWVRTRPSPEGADRSRGRCKKPRTAGASSELEKGSASIFVFILRPQ